MSYQRIQQVLEADATFAATVANKDTQVHLRSGEVTKFSAIVVNVYNTLKAAGCNMQSVPKITVLATAASLSNGGQVPTPAPVPPSAAPVKIVRKKEADKPPTIPKSTTKPVVVTTARPGAPRPITVEKTVDTETIHTYQCAVAGAQLLAALHQLFEKDNYPGHEVRKKKLDDLIDEVEKASSNHVNLSVKAILRAQAAIQARPSN